MDFRVSLEKLATPTNEEIIEVLPEFVKGWLPLQTHHIFNGEAYNLCFVLPATPDCIDLPSIVLVAHHDIWNHGFWVDGIFFPQGALDDRAGIIAILHGMADALWWWGNTSHVQVTLLFTDKEETGFAGSRIISSDLDQFSNVGAIYSVDGPVDWADEVVESRELVATRSGALSLYMASSLSIAAMKLGKKLRWTECDGPGDHTILLRKFPELVVNIRAPYLGNGDWHSEKESTSVDGLMIPYSIWISNIILVTSAYFTQRREIQNGSRVLSLSTG